MECEDNMYHYSFPSERTKLSLFIITEWNFTLNFMLIIGQATQSQA